MFVNVFNLCGKHMRHGIFHGSRNVDNGFMIRCRLPDIKYRIADFDCVIDFGSGAAFRAVLQINVSILFVSKFFYHDGAIYSGFYDFFFALMKNLFSLRHRSGKIQVNDDILSAFNGFESFSDNMFSCLGKHLNGDIFRDHILLN